MKTKDVLVIGGVGLLAYYLLAGGKTQDQGYIISGGSNGGGGVLPDMSGLTDILGGFGSTLNESLGGFGDMFTNLQAQNKSLAGMVADLGKQVTDLTGKIPGVGNLGDLGLGDYTKYAQDAMNVFNGALNTSNFLDYLKGLLPEVPTTKTTAETPTTEPPTPKPDNKNPDSEADIAGMSDLEKYARNKAASEITGLGGLMAGSRLLPMFVNGLIKFSPDLAETILPRIAAGISGIGTPIAIAWTLADIGATVYEGISGHNIAGNWLGWGELLGQTSIGHTLGFADSEVPTPKNQPGPNAAKDLPTILENQGMPPVAANTFQLPVVTPKTTTPNAPPSVEDMRIQWSLTHAVGPSNAYAGFPKNLVFGL